MIAFWVLWYMGNSISFMQRARSIIVTPAEFEYDNPKVEFIILKHLLKISWIKPG